jgi:polysaccharide biosynthesis transport protein
MEIRQYLLFARKWFWLLILGGILGGAAAYVFSIFQPVIYQTSTQIMVSRAQDQENQNYYNIYGDIQLAQNYARLITTTPVLQALSDELGYPVHGGISVKQTSNTNLLEITVNGGDPTRIAQVANTLVSVFMKYNDTLQDELYQSTENNLKDKIAQIETTIGDLQSEMSKVTENTQENQKQRIEEQAKEIENMLAQADQEIIQLETKLDTFIPTPAVTNTPAPSWHIPTSTPVPVPTPTLSSANQLKYKELQIRRDQLNEMRALFQEAYGNLLVLKQDSASDPMLRQNQIQTTLALYQQIYSNLLSSYENVRLARVRSTPTIMQIEPAPVPSAPIQPQPLRNALLGGVSGALIMGAIAFLIEYLDDTLKTPEDINQHLGLPVLGLIGEMGKRKGRKSKADGGVYVAEYPLSPIVESFRTLRTNLDFAGIDTPIRTLQITSAGPSEGKSTVAVNLAVVMAQGERKVILLDADLRRPSVHRYLKISNRKGLIDLLRDPANLAKVITEWGNPPIKVLTVGEIPPNPAELLASERMGKVLEELCGISDILIIDTAPSIITDPIVLSAKVDGVLVVIEPGSTKIGAAQVMMEQLNRAGARVVGVVLNPISRRHSNYYTKYNYYSSYYRSAGYHSYLNGEAKESKKEKS